MAKRTKIEGLKELKRKLTYIPTAARQAAHKGVVEGAYIIAEAQYALAPVDDGDLRNSIEVTSPNSVTPPYSQPGGSVMTGPEQALVTAGNTNVRYAHLVEFGVKEHIAGGIFEGSVIPAIKGQPFFWPGYRAVRGRARAQMRRGINKAMKQAALGQRLAGGSAP